MRTLAGLTGIVAVLAFAGCASVAPNYNPSPASAQRLQQAKVQAARVGEFTAGKDAANTSIQLRGSAMVPKQGTFSQYLADAVRNELELVKLHSPTSAIEITGMLIRNDLNTGLMVTGEGLIEARFVVQRDGKVRFDRTLTAKTQWDTNYFGAIAIPRAQAEYARLVQTLVTQLFAEPDFVAALK